ncbi:hypothetical protein K440DRAFT_621696 [Wilcoxina mikolae CBS 423.85]|nr:hypothetical protein K440DRAFT_621696 [Wilcoxina mikolae CBS 423.85]
MTVNPTISPSSSSDAKINVLVRAQTGGPYTRHPRHDRKSHHPPLLLLVGYKNQRLSPRTNRRPLHSTSPS